MFTLKPLNYPAVILCEMGTLNPTQPRNLSLWRVSMCLIQSSYCFSPDPSITWNKSGELYYPPRFLFCLIERAKLMTEQYRK